MKAERVVAIVRRITYKPGWQLQCTIMEREFLWLRLKFTAPCAIDGQERLQTSAVTVLDADTLYNEHDVLVAVLWAIKRAEEHETLEFLKLNGVAPFDPHRRS
jgi:hypothetical protein